MNNCQLQGALKRTKLEWRSIRKQDLSKKKGHLYSVPKSCCSVTKLWPTFWDAMDWSTPGFPVLRYLPEFTQTHVQWVSDAIQPSHSLSPPSPPALNLSQHQGLFQWRVIQVKLYWNVLRAEGTASEKVLDRKAFDEVRTVARVQEPGRNQHEMNWRCRQKPSPAELYRHGEIKTHLPASRSSKYF